MIKRFSFITLSAFTLFFLTIGNIVRANDLLNIEEATLAWKTLEKAVESCLGTVEAYYGTQRTPLESKTVFMKSSDSISGERWKPDEKGLLEQYKVFCTNPAYCFILKHSPKKDSVADGDSVNEWIVFDVEQIEDTTYKNPIIRNEREYGSLCLLTSPYSLAGFPLYELINDSVFEIKKIYRETSNSEFISIDFQYDIPKDVIPATSGFSPRIVGSITFNPSNYWRIENVKFTVSRNIQGKEELFFNEMLIDYKNTASGIPYASKLTRYRSTDKNTQNSKPYIMELADMEFSEIPNKNFLLSHYGFPEPDFTNHRVNRVRYILITIGVLLIICSLYKMYRERKKKKDAKK
jgi:hypothetical protein